MLLGYMSDPDSLPGLAHLCEHMLFLGTDKVLLFYHFGSEGHIQKAKPIANMCTLCQSHVCTMTYDRNHSSPRSSGVL